MSTRASTARHVRQRKLNPKNPLRIIRENDIDDAPDQESQGQIPQVETGVEKGEEVEFHLQAVINAALGPKTQQSYIPTPEATRATNVNYDELYPRVFSQPATYIRFSSTVEDCVGTSYCMNEDDAKFVDQLNDGKDVNGQSLKDKTAQCSYDTFEEVMSFFEETSQRIQPFANVDSAPVLSLDEMQQHREEPLSSEAEQWLKPIYQFWVSKKSGRALMPAIKIRVLDTTSEADDADPYVCFRRREVRQTRKTRGRDAQVADKIKKLRGELEQARVLVQSIYQREEFCKQNLEITRKVFEQRKQLKDVKIAKNIVGEKGEDEELLVNQRPVSKPKTRPDGTQQRASTTIRLSTRADRSAPENDLISLVDIQADAEAHVNHVIESRKEQHKKWNQHWQDRTWDPLTPPPETSDEPPAWAPLMQESHGYPTPPPSLPSRSSQDRDGDIDMSDHKPLQDDAIAGAFPPFTFFVPPPSPVDDYYRHGAFGLSTKRNPSSACRIRQGRGGRLHLEVRNPIPEARISRGVVSDADSDDEAESYFVVPESKIFEYRCATNSRARPEGGEQQQQRRQWPSGDQTALMAGAQQSPAATTAQSQQQAANAG